MSVNISFKKLTEKRTQQFLGVLLVVLLLSGVGFYTYKLNQTQKKYDQAQANVKRLSNPQEAAKEESRQLVSKVGALAELPKNESPTIATVSDASKLKTQAFFAKAENEDKVLIFSQAKIAILYRSSTDKVINIAPVDIGNNQSQPATTTKTRP